MNGKQELVAAGGLALVGVNFWTSSQRSAVAGTVWSKKDPAASHKVLLAVGGELVLVAVLTATAGSPVAANAAIAIIVALWILWAMKAVHPAGGANPNTGSTPMQSSPGAGGAARREQ